ncbi:MAG: hypothetical protein IJU20_01785 [Clostridia bacterium]|nr:hypothetical protein [Clostridia bacterium]
MAREDTNLEGRERKFNYFDIVIGIVLILCIVAMIVIALIPNQNDNVKADVSFQVHYKVDAISTSAVSTIEFGDMVWMEDGTPLGSFQMAVSSESQLILKNEQGIFVTVANPDDSVRSLTGIINTTGDLSSENTLLLNGKIQILPGQEWNVHTKFADFVLKITDIEVLQSN